MSIPYTPKEDRVNINSKLLSNHIIAPRVLKGIKLQIAKLIKKVI